MNKFKLVMMFGLIITPNIILVYAVLQNTDAVNASQNGVVLNDPTMPKLITNFNQANSDQLNNIKKSQKRFNSNELKLSVIIIRSNDKSAVINEKIVREKDQISGYEVVEIKNNKVILKNPKEINNNKKSKAMELITDLGQEASDTFTELKLPTVNMKIIVEGISEQKGEVATTKLNTIDSKVELTNDNNSN